MAEQRYKIGALPTRNVTHYTTTSYLTVTFRQLEIVNIGNNIYQSLVDDNVGNALTDASKWVCLMDNDAYNASFNEAEAARQQQFNEDDAAWQASVDAKLAEIDAMEFDNVPTEGSIKAVKSNGVWSENQIRPHAIDNDYSDFAISDIYGMAICVFSNGHIKTKYFDSAALYYNDYSSKIVNCLGDSITYGYISSGNRANPTWVQGVHNNIGCICNNYGVSATSICDGSSESFVTRLNNMSEQNVDILLIFGGTNDYGDKRAHTLGTISDTPAQGTNFYASFKYLIEAAITKYPSAIIGVITPLRRSTYAANSYGISMEDIVTAEINVAKYYGLPLLDMYHHGSLNPQMQILRTNYTADGLHPNQNGINRFLIPKISDFTYNIIKYLK